MTRGRAVLALVLLLAAFFGPRLVRGQVVYPHENELELGLPYSPSGFVQNRKFSDLSSVFVPELHHHLHGDASGWISTWNPHVQLGRPTMQLSGLGPAFPLTRVLMLLTRDATVVYTWLTVLTLCGCALFGFLFLCELGLRPAASLAAAVALSLGLSLYWAALVMYLAGVCWTLCVLWLAAGWIREARLARGIGLAAAVYALLLTAYPQQIVWHLYLTAGFVAWRLFSDSETKGRRMRTLLGLGGFGLLGALCAAPLFADVALQASRSSRLAVDPEFFLHSLPQYAGWRGLGVFLTAVFDVFWIGNPIESEFPFQYRWVNLTPIPCALLFVSALGGGWRRCWFWLGFAAICFALTLSPKAYLFGVSHLGLGLSRFTPLTAALIPVTVCVGSALDRLLAEGPRPRFAAIALSLVGPAVAAFALVAAGLPRPGLVAWTGLALFVLFLACVWSGRTQWIPVLVCVSAFHYGWRLALFRPEATIHRTSPLVDAIRAGTPGGLRYAVVSPEDPRLLLPPNQEAWLDLASVHSYDSLAPRAYAEWTRRISAEGARTYGRHFRGIVSDEKLDSDEVDHAGIAVLVSPFEIHPRRFVPAGRVGGIGVWRAREVHPLEAQVEGFERDGEGVRLRAPLARQSRLALARTVSRDDRLAFRATAAPVPTLLFVSQQFHPHWRARSGAQALETVAIDGMWQGVLLPPGTSEVELSFSPWILWSWVPQALLTLAAVVLALARLSGRARARSPRTSRSA